MGTVSIFVCLLVGRRCEYSFACMRVGTYACVYVCLFVFVYMSGRASDSTSLIISVDPHPTNMPCQWRMPPVRWWFLAPRQDARVSAGPLSAVAWRGLALLALLGPDWGVGAFGSRAQGPVCPGVVGCRWSLRACRHGTLGRLHCGCRSPTFGLSSALFWVEAAVVPAVVLLGFRALGGPRMFGARSSFPCLLHALRDGAAVPHTHY